MIPTRQFTPETLSCFTYLTRDILDVIIFSGQKALEVRSRGLLASVKSSKEDLVTEGDTEVSSYLQETLSLFFPDIRYIDEEADQTHNYDLDTSDLIAIIDPIDGTSNYFNQIPSWGVSVGLVKNREVIAGIIFEPEANDLYFSEIGKGAFLNHERLSVNTNNNINKATCIGSPPYPKDKIAYAANNRIKTRFLEELQIDCVSLGSQVIEAMQVARGKRDFFIHCKTKPWDIAAAQSIVTEAGGKVLTAYGESYSLFEETILLTNGILDPGPLVKIIGEELPQT